MNLGQRTKKALREAVDKEGSQVNLARRTGVSKSVINLFYGGKRDVANMPVATLEKLFPDMSVSFFKDQKSYSELSQEDNDLLQVLHNFDKLDLDNLIFCLIDEHQEKGNLRCLDGDGSGLPPAHADDYSRLIMKKISKMSVHQRIQVLAEIEKMMNLPARSESRNADDEKHAKAG